MSWLRVLLRYYQSSRTKLVGTDLAGNQYYARVGHGGERERRSMKLKILEPVEDYTPDSVPPEWDRWLRGLEEDPPTMEEMIERVRQAQVLQRKVQEVEKSDKLLRDKERAGEISGAEGTKAAGHAAAPTFTSPSAPMDEPTSTGTKFQPASWKPRHKKN